MLMLFEKKNARFLACVTVQTLCTTNKRYLNLRGKCL